MSSVTHFPIGVYDSADRQNGDVPTCEAMFADILAHNMDTLQWANVDVIRDAACLDLADTMGITIYPNCQSHLNTVWWNNDTVTEDLATAREIAAPLVAELSTHSSVAGYPIADELFQTKTNKLILMMQAFRELDPSRPVFASHSADIPYAAYWPDVESQINPAVWQVFLYLLRSNPDYGETEVGAWVPDFEYKLRTYLSTKPPGMPWWFIPQSFQDPSMGQGYRFPTAAELRLQQWISVGYGVKGLIWFGYSGGGLRSVPALFDEVASLSLRLRSIAPILLTTQPAESLFTLTGLGHVYALQNATGSYALVVNGSCTDSQAMSLTSPRTGMLGNIETGAVIDQGGSFTLAPGDGAVFRLFECPLPDPGESLRATAWKRGLTDIAREAARVARVVTWINQAPVEQRDALKRAIGGAR